MKYIESEPNAELVEYLLDADPILNPIELASLSPAYGDVHAWSTKYGMWSSLESMQKLTENTWQNDKVLLLISGVAAGGKDAIREKIEEIIPGFSCKAVTGTSRKPRDGEEHGFDYYFYKSPEEFEREVEKGRFIEWVRQGERWYGMPKQSLEDALRKSDPVITSHVEMGSGWPAMEEFATTDPMGLRVFPLKVFVLPNMRFSEYAKTWLPERREDVQTRLERAAWEILLAANNADLIVTNTITDNPRPLDWEAKALADITMRLLDPESHEFRGFGKPFEVSAGIAGNKGDQGVVDYHAGRIRSESR